MLRTLVVVAALAIGWGYAFQSALYAAGLYLWIAYFRPESWAWSGIFASLNLSYFAGVFLILRTMASPTPFKVDFRRGLLFLFLALSLLSTAFSPTMSYSFGYWQAFAKTIIVSYLLTIIVRTPADLRFIFMVIALSLAAEAAKQGWAGLMLNPGSVNTNEIPFLGDNNLVAVGMAMLMPMVAALGQTAAKPWHKRVLQFLNVGILYRTISTYSRGGFLAVIGIGGMYFWRSPYKMRTALAGILAVAIVLPTLPPAFWARMSTITAKRMDERDASQLGRLHFWHVATLMARDHPLLGVGHRGYEPNYNRYDTSGGEFETARAVHSAWFGVLAELGYPGFLLFVSIIALSFRSCRRVRAMAARGEIPGPLGPYATGLESSLVAFVIGGSFVSFHYSEMLWHFFALTIALESVALTEAAAHRARVEVIAAPPPAATKPVPDFAWA